LRFRGEKGKRQVAQGKKNPKNVIWGPDSISKQKEGLSNNNQKKNMEEEGRTR